MTKSTEHPLDGRQFMAFVFAKLGKAAVQRILRPQGETIDDRTVYRWTSDPRHAAGCDSIRRNPIERVKGLLEEAVLFGHVEEVKALLAWFADAADCDVVSRGDECEPDKAALGDEMLDDYPALVAFHDSLRSLTAGAGSVEAVLDAERAAVQEIKETKILAFRTAGRHAVSELGNRDRKHKKNQNRR